MEDQNNQAPAADLRCILESAQRLGVEMDEEEALQWLTAIAASRAALGQVVVDPSSGVFGHRVSMLDFDSADLAYFRQVGRLVEFADEPPFVETALALSGSAAQSRIQTHPGDLDYFERVNIKAATREEACRILSRLMRDKALNTISGETYRLIEAKFGNYPCDVVRDERLMKKGVPIAWKPEEIRDGKITATQPDGTPVTITWEEVSADPGWCKLDWVVADPVRASVANASNMLDVTWESPDGTITPLDGYLDPYFQEVYLEADSIPIFSKLVRHMSNDALDNYVAQLEREVAKYLTKDVNYGKAAKRMYNIFRLTGRYQEAAYLRELFDEPAAMLYQVWALIRTVEEASMPGATIALDAVLAQTDELILAVTRALEGEKEVEIVRYLLRLRDSVAAYGKRGAEFSQVEAARQEVINLVNNFFYEKLTAIPAIRAYMEERMQTAL
ncbi:MAG: hypothetical protein NZ765_10160 [Anaerolineae bacterium]|nr:hypothetical protein [Anaerolineae bacterium]MDW8072007.1 hypothetical protein [Anaerolineae bacterium]